METGSEQGVPFWNVNLPRDQWTNTCPDYLLGIDHWDQAQLTVRDEDYTPMSWDEVKDLVETNHLEEFKRVPSSLHRYRRYIKDIKLSHGSVMNFILQERLRWKNKTPEAAPFESSADIKILYNDWPYGIDPDIVHLVVWTKFGFAEEAETGDLTTQTRRMIEEYVQRTFAIHHDRAQLLWFKNWAALKSVHAVEHFHIMLHKPDPGFVSNITSGDVPMSQR